MFLLADQSICVVPQGCYIQCEDEKLIQPFLKIFQGALIEINPTTC